MDIGVLVPIVHHVDLTEVDHELPYRLPVLCRNGVDLLVEETAAVVGLGDIVDLLEAVREIRHSRSASGQAELIPKGDPNVGAQSGEKVILIEVLLQMVIVHLLVDLVRGKGVQGQQSVSVDVDRGHSRVPRGLMEIKQSLDEGGGTLQGPSVVRGSGADLLWVIVTVVHNVGCVRLSSVGEQHVSRPRPQSELV